MSSIPAESRVTPRALSAFWLPLAFMWLVMGIEQPAINAVVSRLPQATRSLAAFEVAFGLAILIHSPIVHMLSAATAVVRGRQSFLLLSRMLTRVTLALSAVHALVAMPPVFRVVVGGLLNVPPQIVPIANQCFILFLPFTAAVGFRRMYQGALIRAGKTHLVSSIMVIRLATTALVLAGAFLAFRTRASRLLPGHLVAGLALTGGVVSGAIAARRAVRRHLFPVLPEVEEERWDVPRLFRFYLPLALTAMILMAGRPLLAFAIARSRDPVRSLASWPLIQSYLFMFTAIAHSYQEVVVARVDIEGPYGERRVRRFGLTVGAALTALFALAMVTGATSWWYEFPLGVPAQLRSYVEAATPILTPMSIIVALIAVEAGVLVARRRTQRIVAATVANGIVQVVLGIVIPITTDLDGARVAAIILTTAAASQLVVLRAGRRYERSQTRSMG